MNYDFLSWTVLHDLTTWQYRKVLQSRLPFILDRIWRVLASRPSLHIRLLKSTCHCSPKVLSLCSLPVPQPAPKAPALASSVISVVKVKAVVPPFMEKSHHTRQEEIRSVSQNRRLQWKMTAHWTSINLRCACLCKMHYLENRTFQIGTV